MMTCHAQGSGKSTITSQLTAAHGVGRFETVSGDLHGTKAKQVKRFKGLVQSGANIVVDNTNAAKADRDAWAALAPGYKVTVFHITVAKDQKAAKERSFHCVRCNPQPPTPNRCPQTPAECTRVELGKKEALGKRAAYVFVRVHCGGGHNLRAC